MFKVQAARRGKTVELQRHEFARILRQQCFYCSSTERIGVDRVQNDGHYTLANSVPRCALCNYMEACDFGNLQSTRTESASSLAGVLVLGRCLD